MEAIVSGPGGALGLADELGLTLGEGEMLALGDCEADGERDALPDAEGLNEGDTEAEGLMLALGLIDDDGLMLGDTDDEGETLADGLTENDAAPIDAHTFTPLVAFLTMENVWIQNSYVPLSPAGQMNSALLSASGSSLSGDNVSTPPGSVTYTRAYCPPAYSPKMIAPRINDSIVPLMPTCRVCSNPSGGMSASSNSADGGAVSQMSAGLVAVVAPGMPNTDSPIEY